MADYTTRETSEYESNPVEVYTFQRGSRRWNYTSSDEDKVLNSVTYRAVPISRSRIEATQDPGKTSLTISVQNTLEFVRQYVATSPTDVVSVSLQRYHEGFPDEVVVPWRGRVTNVSFNESTSETEITCQPLYTSLRRPGLRRVYQSSCPHVLYNSPCNVVRENLGAAVVVESVTGNVLQSSNFIQNTANPFAADWFTGGFIEVNIGQGAIDRRFIIEHDNDAGTVTLNLPASSIVAGTNLIAYAGCNHSPTVCKGKFNNLDNYGGFPFIPTKNPMDGTPIF